jgi:hypothetical protein
VSRRVVRTLEAAGVGSLISRPAGAAEEPDDLAGLMLCDCKEDLVTCQRLRMGGKCPERVRVETDDPFGE